MNGTTIVFDLETGGVEPQHPTIQVAAVAVTNPEGDDWREVASFERKIQFDPSKCDPEALKVNGYSPERWAGKAVTLAAAMQDFDAFCKKHGDLELVSKKTGRPYKVARLAGHNIVAFDVPRVRKDMERVGVKFWKACWWYPCDLYQLAIWHFTASGLPWPMDFRLETLCEHYGVDATGAHDALADVRMSARLMKALLKDRAAVA